MFVRFAINGRPMQKRAEWTEYVQAARPERRERLMEELRCVRGGHVPNFSMSGRGRTLIEWARARHAQYTLCLEIATA